jgi:hypothetical protein
MSRRRRDHDDPHVRRLDDNIRKAHLAALRSGLRAIDIDDEINRQARADGLRHVLDRILQQRASIRALLSGPPLAGQVDTEDWLRQLDDSPLTGSRAETELVALLEQIEEERHGWSVLILGPLMPVGDDAPFGLSSVAGWLDGQLDRTVAAIDRRAVRRQLVDLVSSIELLLTHTRRYEQLRLH